LLNLCFHKATQKNFNQFYKLEFLPIKEVSIEALIYIVSDVLFPLYYKISLGIEQLRVGDQANVVLTEFKRESQLISL
jgi:hypothetical protein